LKEALNMTMQGCLWCSPDSNTAKEKGITSLCGCCMEHFFLPPDGPMQKHLDGLLFPVLGIELYAGKHMITRAVNKNACACCGWTRMIRELRFARGTILWP
jgi:hypothetical protein